MQSVIIRAAEAGQRLNKFMNKYLPEAPNSFIYKMLRKKNIVLNGKKADGSEKLSEGDEIKLFLADETIDKFSRKGSDHTMVVTAAVSDVDNSIDKLKTVNAENAGFVFEDNIIYEDEEVLLVNKPAGILSQKAEARDISMVEYLLDYLTRTGFISSDERRGFQPGICNRLDRNTSGLLIAGKTLKGSQVMSALIKDRTVKKFYRCIVKGVVTKEQKIDGYLVKDSATNTVKVTKTKPADLEGLPISTRYIPINNNGKNTLLEVELITGRTHQIRAHLSSIGHPIIGDAKYGDKKTNSYFKKKYDLGYQLLHSYRLEFPKECELLSGQKFIAPLAVKFTQITEGEGL
ncbi:MAG: RluA family pseudouridine synthase [Lachnospiraceae bacterium]|nr:RluA family pseudouridine synthase [Lachnospiraceae bacterium]